MKSSRAVGALLVLAALAASLGARAATHAHGHCATDGASGVAVAPTALTLSELPSAPIAVAAAAGPSRGADGSLAHEAGSDDSMSHHGHAAESANGAALGPMADCTHCTGGRCEMTTGCSTAGAPFAPLAAATPRGPAGAGHVGPHRHPAAWRSAALDPPTPPPNRFG